MVVFKIKGVIMDPKERVLTVLDHKKADRVPVTNRFTSEISLEISRVLKTTINFIKFQLFILYFFYFYRSLLY